MTDYPIDCESAMRQLFDFLDEELTDERMSDVREHLMSCSRCLPHHDFERAFLQALASTRVEHVAPSELRGRVLDSLRKAGFIAPG